MSLGGHGSMCGGASGVKMTRADCGDAGPSHDGDMSSVPDRCCNYLCNLSAVFASVGGMCVSVAGMFCIRCA